MEGGLQDKSNVVHNIDYAGFMGLGWYVRRRKRRDSVVVTCCTGMEFLIAIVKV
jgi:hypothetical protein